MGIMDGNISIPKPRKPMPADKRTVDYTKTSYTLDKKTNYLLEMLKFMPNYARKSLDLTATADDYSQYGEPTADGLLTFGVVTANERYYGGAYGASGLQLLADNAADFQHLDGVQLSSNPLNSLISPVLWSKVMNNLKTESRSYYDIMMEDGVESYSPDRAFSLLTAMLESRTRVSSTLSEIFGQDGQSASQRVAVFEQWRAANMDGLDPAKLAFLGVFLNASQSFVAHILPMYGQSDALYESALDKTKAQNFAADLNVKARQYIDLLADPAEKSAAEAILAEWLNPSALPSAAQNVDPGETDWGQAIGKKLQTEMDKIVNSNIANRVAYRNRYERYKKEKEEYDEEIEELENEEMRQERLQKQKQAELKALDEKIAEQNRQNAKVRTGAVKEAKPVEKKPEKEKEKEKVKVKQIQQTPQQQQQVTRAKATTAAKPAARPAPKPTIAAAPVKVNAVKKNNDNNVAVAAKPVARVRSGAVQQAAPAAAVQTKKVLAVQSVRTAKGKKARRVRPRSKRVWGRPTVFKL